MEYTATSIRGFIGAKDFGASRLFYRSLGFEEGIIDASMSLFTANANLTFYLQDYYVKDWVDNSMMLLEVDDLDACHHDVTQRQLPEKFKGVRLSPIVIRPWGREFFLHDPSGVLWHFAQFKAS